MKARKIDLVIYILLIIWYTLDLFGIPGFVTRVDWLSIEGLLELLLVLILIGYLQQ
jgi:hypothetical protein